MPKAKRKPVKRVKKVKRRRSITLQETLLADRVRTLEIENAELRKNTVSALRIIERARNVEQMVNEGSELLKRFLQFSQRNLENIRLVQHRQHEI
jgi:hypothetical protein